MRKNKILRYLGIGILLLCLMGTTLGESFQVAVYAAETAENGLQAEAPEDGAGNDADKSGDAGNISGNEENKPGNAGDISGNEGNKPVDAGDISGNEGNKPVDAGDVSGNDSDKPGDTGNVSGNDISAGDVSEDDAVAVGNTVEAVLVEMNGESLAFSTWEKAVAYVNQKGSRKTETHIYLQQDVESSTKTLAFPKYPLTLHGNGYTLHFAGTTVSLPADTALENVQLETSAKGGFNLNASGSLTMNSVNEKQVPEGSYGIKAVRGAASKKLTYLDKNVENPITGFGTVCFGEDTEVSAVLTLKKVQVAAGKTLRLQNTFKADEIRLGENAGLMVGCGKTVSVKDLYAEGQNAALTYRYTEGEKFVPLTVTGKVYGAAGSVEIARFTFDRTAGAGENDITAIPFAAGETLLLAKTADLAAFRVAADCLVPGSGENEYCLTRKNNAVFLKETGFQLDGEDTLFFAEWKDVKEYIENRKQKTAEYRITLLRDYDAGGAFTLPKTGTYAGFTLTGALLTDEEDGSRYPALTFTGNLTLTGNVTIEKLKRFCSVKKAGTDLTADFAISMGNYRLELKEVAESSLKNISGSAGSTLILHGISVKGTITAGNLFMENVTAGGNVRAMGECLTVGEIKIPGTFTAEGLQKSYAQTVLNVRQGKKITIGKKGILSCNPQIFLGEQTAPAAEYGIGIRMENAKGELLTFTAADRNFAVADITGGFANGDVYLAGQTNTLLVRSSNKLVYSGSTEGLWSWKADSGETAYFLSYADAVKEISRRKDTGAVYEMTLQENLFLKGNFVMPAKNTCKEFILWGNGSSISYTGAMTLTCNLTLHGITVSKKNTTGKVLNQNVSLDAYRLNLVDGSGLEALQNLSGRTGATLYAEDSSVTVKGNVSGKINLVSKNTAFAIFGNVAVGTLDASESTESCSFSVNAGKTITVENLKGPAAAGASWEIVSPESNITVKDFAGGNVSVGYSVKKNLKFAGKVTGTGCITLIPMKTTPDKYHIIATLTRNEKVVTQVSSYYDISCFKLLDSVNVPAGSSLKKKGTTVILEMP